MDRPRDDHTNWSKSDKVKQIHHIIPMWNLISENDTNETYLRNRNRHIDMETNLWLPKGKHGEKA